MRILALCLWGGAFCIHPFSLVVSFQSQYLNRFGLGSQTFSFTFRGIVFQTPPTEWFSYRLNIARSVNALLFLVIQSTSAVAIVIGRIGLALFDFLVPFSMMHNCTVRSGDQQKNYRV